MAIVLYFLQRNYPPSVRGLTSWAAGTGLLFLAGLTASTRGFLPDLFAIAVANLLVFSGVYLQYFGSQQFFGLQPRFWPRYWHHRGHDTGIDLVPRGRPAVPHAPDGLDRGHDLAVRRRMPI